jgi:hypothetical protein
MALCLFVQPARPADPPMGKVIWWGNGGMDLDRQTPGYEHTNGVIESQHQILTNVIAFCPRGEMVLRSDGTPFQLGYMMDLPPPGMQSMFVFSTDVPAGLSNVVSLAFEGQSYWGIRQDGSVKQWGNDIDDANVVSKLSNIKSIASAGASNFLALKNDGTLLGFRLREGSSNAPVTDPAIRTVTVAGQVLSNVVAVAPLGISPLVIKRDGTVLALGCQTPGVLPRQPQYRVEGNTYEFDPGGEFSQAPYQYTSADPVMAAGKALTNVVAIASSVSHSLALRDDGTVVSFGENVTNVAPVPSGLRNVIAIAVDENFSLALKRDGTVAAWGDNSSNQTAVPAGLSNVVAIATGMGISGVAFALTTGNVPASVHIEPRGELEETAEISDLIFKGQVLSSAPAGNPGFLFQDMNLHETKLKVISVLKGNPTTNIIGFQHFTTPVRAGGSGPIGPPAYYLFQPGETYLIFAASLDKGDFYYSPSTNFNHRPDQLRQISGQNFFVDGVISTLDARPLDGLTIKEAYWLEMNLLLNGTNPTNALHAIDRLGYMSVPLGGREDRWNHNDVFKRVDLLKALLPLVTNKDEQTAIRAIRSFATDSASASQLEPFADVLIRTANNGPSASIRLETIKALSGAHGDAVSNSLALLLKCPDENIRASAVTLLPRFPLEFAETALRERATDESAGVRSVVADVIGQEKYAPILPTLMKLYVDGTGDARTRAGRALLSFDLGQVAGVLKTNLNDPALHVEFVLKLAEKDATAWLPELAGVLESRIKHAENYSKLAADDPNKFLDTMGDVIITGPFATAWDDIRLCLLNLPKEKLSGADMERYMDLLDRAVKMPQPMAPDEVRVLYEFYRTKGLEQRASAIRRKFAGDGAAFDEFDRQHPELEPGAKP